MVSRDRRRSFAFYRTFSQVQIFESTIFVSRSTLKIPTPTLSFSNTTLSNSSVTLWNSIFPFFVSALPITNTDIPNYLSLFPFFVSALPITNTDIRRTPANFPIGLFWRHRTFSNGRVNRDGRITHGQVNQPAVATRPMNGPQPYCPPAGRGLGGRMHTPTLPDTPALPLRTAQWQSPPLASPAPKAPPPSPVPRGYFPRRS